MNETKRRITTSLMITAATVLLLLPRSTVTAQVQDKAAATALKAAIDKETLEGDPKSAIEQYKKIAESKDPSVAAQALIHLAESYRKFGDAESQRIYERIVKDYRDQKEPYALAQARLGGKDQATGVVSRTVGPFPGSQPGTLSRDGRFFSYSDRRDVFVHEIATGRDRNLTNQPSDSKDIAFESAISPDGKRIAYTWYKAQDKRYDLRLANLTGGPNPQQLYDNSDIYDIFLADWSPDGKWLAVEVQRVDKKIAQIGLVSVSDGSLRVLKSIDWAVAKAVRGMYFSPDGKYVGYDLPLSNSSQERDVYVLSVDGSREIPVIKQPGSDEMVGWSPDGKWLLFKSNHTAINPVTTLTGQADLWAIAFADGKPHGMPQPLRANVGASFRPMGWTVSGALYYQASNSRRPNSSKVQLASLDFPTGKFVSVPIPLTRGYQENTSSPLWSPDGKRLAYLSELQDRGVNNDELVIWAPDTGTIRELRTKQLGAIVSIFAWAPDGTALMVGASDLRDRRGIFRVDAETGDASVIVLSTPDINFAGFTWMPDGLSFLSFSTGAKRGLYRVDMQTGVPALVLEPKGPLDMFSPSPNGKTLYYTQSILKKDKSDGTVEVAFIERDVATGNEKELIRKDHSLYAKCSPDGQYCAVTSSDAASNSRVLLLFSSSGGKPSRELLRLPAEVKPEDLSKANVGPWIFTLSWTADSRSLLLRKVEPNKDDELWIVSVDGQPSGKLQHTRVPEILPSPDNRYAAYRVLGSATTEISVLENFLPKSTPARK